MACSGYLQLALCTRLELVPGGNAAVLATGSGQAAALGECVTSGAVSRVHRMAEQDSEGLHPSVTVVQAVRRFVDSLDADDDDRRAYESTLWRLSLHVGVSMPISAVTRAEVAGFLLTQAKEDSPADRLHRLIVSEFSSWCVQTKLTPKSFAWGIRRTSR